MQERERHLQDKESQAEQVAQQELGTLQQELGTLQQELATLRRDKANLQAALHAHSNLVCPQRQCSLASVLSRTSSDDYANSIIMLLLFVQDGDGVHGSWTRKKRVGRSE
jgi:hypothetical protein